MRRIDADASDLRFHRDLQPVARISSTVVCLVVPTAMKIDSMKEFIAQVRAQPGKMNWSATQGLPHMLFGAFLRAAKLDLSYVPYSALGPALQDLGQGRIQAYATSFASLGPLFESGDAIPLAVLNASRGPQLPDVPTARELGLPELTVVSFNGFFAPKEMAAATIAQIEADIRDVSADAEMGQRFAKMGSMMRVTGSAEFTKMIAEQRATVEGILRATGELK